MLLTSDIFVVLFGQGELFSAGYAHDGQLVIVDYFFVSFVEQKFVLITGRKKKKKYFLLELVFVVLIYFTYSSIICAS